jgi:hypothetical protein
MGEMKEERCGHYFPSSGGSRGRPWGGARPTGGGGLCVLFWCARRKKMAGWAKWAESPYRPAGRWADWADS